MDDERVYPGQYQIELAYGESEVFYKKEFKSKEEEENILEILKSNDYYGIKPVITIRKVVRILWISRHKMTEVQIEELKACYGAVEIVQHADGITHWSEVVKLSEGFDILAVVLPNYMLMKLMDPNNNTKPIIISRTDCKYYKIDPKTKRRDASSEFVHKRWERLKVYKYETEPLLPELSSIPEED